ncbi:hypothetical protein TNCV_3183451 [Trichonephila clavipes]|uniref:Uncharacterized protein n=1 Tax=Trichonephila clavipes TaxID=2585209 RepID=A0A8X6SCQ4_TRICX|nr:hypothetical protein TNCV_3183451 [Trichonephila clavipes]
MFDTKLPVNHSTPVECPKEPSSPKKALKLQTDPLETTTPIVRVQYFVRGGFVGHRSRASSKHLSPPVPVDELDSSGVKKGLRCTCKLHVWVSGLQRNRPDVDVWRSDVTALALSYRTFPLRKV